MATTEGYGTAFSAIGGLMGSVSSVFSAEMQAKIDRDNAAVLDALAKDALSRGRLEEQRKRQQVAQFAANQRVSFAASGVDVTGGSVQDILADTYMLGEIDALLIRGSARQEARGIQAKAGQTRQQAYQNQAEGGMKFTAGILDTARVVSDYWATKSASVSNVSFGTMRRNDPYGVRSRFTGGKQYA